MTSFLPQEIIRKKRDGEVLSETEIASFVQGIADGTISDGQVAAFAMAVFFRSMEAAEQAALTRSMTTSGRVLDWRTGDFDGPIVDKHSTGGVGDKVSLILAPIVAACGAYVPMISGRGLGHTGGTLDKLECIPGYNALPDFETFMATTREVRCSIIGQTGELAPADQRLYAMRDVTATVESIPLITASILSKKLAAGLDGLVMDVKFGSGAFMRSIEDARPLARNIAEVAAHAGLPTTSLLTDMNQVLGRTAGNALELLETIAFLKGDEQDPRLRDCTLALADHMLRLAGLAGDGKVMAEKALADGRAAEVFQKMIAAHGGPADFTERPDAYLPTAPVIRPILAAGNGYVRSVDARAIGMAVVSLGGGRTRSDQDIDPAVGLADVVALGAEVETGGPLAIVHARDGNAAEAAEEAIRAAIEIGAAPIEVPPVVAEIIPASEVTL